MIPVNNFNIVDMYSKVFGIVGNVYAPADVEPEFNNNNGNYDNHSFPSKSNQHLSAWGAPYFQRTKINGFYLPNEPIVSISGGKVIVKTQIDSNDGTFKESMALDDYRITIRGLCIQEDLDDPDAYPEDQVRLIRQLFEERESVDIVNDILTLLGITTIAIENLQLDGLVGSPGVQPYIINALSDKNFDLELKEI